MSKAGDKILEGLEDALAFARGDHTRATLWERGPDGHMVRVTDPARLPSRTGPDTVEVDEPDAEGPQIGGTKS